jgi:arylsulfatase A-like enzyme
MPTHSIPRGRAAAWLALALCLVVAPARAARAEPRPNVLMIVVDDLNDWVGHLGGHPQAKTPHMDRLATRGTHFVNAHCQAPLCNSSRTSVLTGLRPSTSGVYALDPWFRTAPRWKDWITLPQYFARHGYRTFAAGKIYHDAYPPGAGRADGVEFDVFGYHGNAGPFPPRKFVETPAPTRLMDWGAFPARDEEQEDYKIADWAVERIRSMPKDKPFFLSVGFRRPHVPCFASRKWFDLYPEETLVLPPVKAGDRDDVPRFAWHLHWELPEPRLAWLERENEWRPLVRAYLACVSFADSQVGRLLDALDAAGLRDDTVVVLWSDHGFHLGEKQITGKNTLWERSTRVPLIFAGPGVAAGGKCARPAELLDVYPTLVELCGLPANDRLEGHSLVPQLGDAAAPRPFPAAITTHGPNNHAVRSERFRYIRYADGSEELYDLRADPNEWTNLGRDAKYAGVVREHARWLPEVNADPIPGSRTRLIEVKGGVPIWEGKPIGADDAVPERPSRRAR